eukprot:2630555-Rhodomonas_salina.1
MRTTVIKDTFGVVDTKKYCNLDYTSEADFKASIQSTLEGNQLEIIKFFIDRLQTATFPKGSTDNGSVHNCVLRSILYDLLITKIMKKGFTPDDIVHWYARPWLHPVVQLWFKILLKYEGVSETVDSNFVVELVLQLEAAQRAFTTVKDLCEHLLICALTSIVKDLAHSEIAEANAWWMVDNHLLAYKATTSASAVPMSISTVTAAISTAQKHIEQMPDKIVTPTAALALKAGGPKTVLKVGSKLARTVEFEDEDVTAETLAAEISAEQ